MLSIQVSFSWQHVGEVELSPSGQPAFPALPRPDVVGVYRIELTEDGRRRVYVGETGRGLRRRWQDYERGRGTSTASKMHVRLQRCLAESAEPVTVSRVVDLSVLIDETPADPRAIPGPFLRRLVENAALVEEHSRGANVINGVGYLQGDQ